MNVCNYINSNDVRVYLDEMGYKFSSPEAAFLVYHCDNLPLEERMQAWQEIIDTIPDEEIPARTWCEPADSFHAKLADYMELQRRKLAVFPKGNGYVYRYIIYVTLYNGEKDWVTDEDVYFSDYEKCLDYCMRNALKEEGTDKFAIFKCKIDPELDDTSNKLGDHIEISRDGKILAIENTFASPAYDDEYTLDLDCMFDGMCFDFPTPFSRGDIVTTHGHRECSGIPFVFLYISTWKSRQMLRRGYAENECPWTKGWEEFDKCRDRLLERGDLTDMHILGVIADQGNLYHDNILVVPTDLEYYHGNLEGYNRQLRAVSLYERGKLDYEVLVNSCAAIRAEEIAKQIMEDCTRPYNKETMQKIGLIPPDGNDERMGSHVI